MIKNEFIKVKIFSKLFLESYEISKLEVGSIIGNVKQKAIFFGTHTEIDALNNLKTQTISEIENNKSDLNKFIQETSYNGELLYTNMTNLTDKKLKFFINQLAIRMSIKYISIPDDTLYNRSDNSLYSEIKNTLLKYQIIATLNDQQIIPDSNKNDNISNPKQVIIPVEILQALEQNCYITQEPLKWLKSKSLLAYFVDVANDELNLKKGERRQIAPFEKMFNVSGLTGCINEYKNKTGQKPSGYNIIDDIFNLYKNLK